MEMIAKGYSIKTVHARIADMDIDASGNSERAAWKRYLSLCLLAIAKAEDRKDLQKAVFGNGKPSKTFQNMWSLANKCRAYVTGNRDWSDILPLGIDEAQNLTLDMINTHMAVLGVSGKNAYEPLCNLSMAEVDAKRQADEERAAATAADEASPADAGDKAAKAGRSEAGSAHERTTVEAVMVALHDASLDDRMAIMGLIAQTIGEEHLRIFAENVIASLDNAAAVRSTAPLAIAA